MKIKIGKTITYIDKADWLPLSELKWWAGKYVYTQINGKTIYLHRLVLNASKKFEVDHINGNGLDNRRRNLRLATRSQNEANKPKPAHNTSGYKGVSLYKPTGRSSAYIEIDQKKKHLGYFSTAHDAAKAYNFAAKENFGAFAQLNILEAI